MKFTCEQVARAGLGEPVRREGAELLYRCPGPERHKNQDAHPSLKVNPSKNMWGCFVCNVRGKSGWSLAAFIAGVSPDDKAAVIAWLKEHGLVTGAKRKAKADGRGPVVASYVYTDVHGNPLARKLRYEPGAKGEKKTFGWQRRENGAWVDNLTKDGQKLLPLYRITQIVKEQFVVITEGEKDADKGAEIDLPTTTSGGTGTWQDHHSDSLRAKDVVVLADGDDKGRVDAQKRAASLYGKAASVAVTEMPGFHDLADAIAGGMSHDAILANLLSAPDWRPPTAAEILDDVMSFIRRFVSLAESQARVIALWVAHTHALDAGDCTPYLAVNSPEKQSGKTRLLEVLRLLVCGAWFTGRVTAAVLYRKVDTERPTLLLDESDAAFKGEESYAEALRGVLNTGYRIRGATSGCVGQGANITYKDFSTFCPKAIAGLKTLPDTVADRSIPIRLKRARRGEVARFREREAQREASDIAAKLGMWCAASVQELREARPEIPARLSDRQADCCEPLIAIADLAGGDWPEAARKAIVRLCGEAQAGNESDSVRLLADIKGIFTGREPGEIPSADLCEALAQIETSPWAEWSKGKPLSKVKLSRLLKPFEIYPAQIRSGSARGYRLADFQEAFSLYLPPESVKVSETGENSGDAEDLKVSNESESDTLKSAISGSIDAASRHFDTLKPGVEVEAKSEIPAKGNKQGELALKNDIECEKRENAGEVPVPDDTEEGEI
jgi:hypothetical protein